MRVCAIWGVILAAFLCNASRADIELSLDPSCDCADSYASLAIEAPAHLAPLGTITVTDDDPTSLTATLPPPHADGDSTEGLSLDSAATIAAAGLTVTYDAANGVLSIAGNATAATYETILNGIVYANGALLPDTTPRVVTVVVDNGVSSDSRTSTVYLSPQTAPSGSDQVYDTFEDAAPPPPFTFPFTWSDPPGPCGIQLVSAPAKGSLESKFNPGTPFADGDNIPVETGLFFSSPLDENGIPYTTFTFKVRDKLHQLSSATYTYTVNVASANDFPYITQGIVQVVKNAGAQSVPGFISMGPADEAGQIVTIDSISNTNAALFAAQPSIDPSGTLTFTPALDAVGAAEVTVRFHDDGGTDNGGLDENALVFLIEVMTIPFSIGDIIVADRGPYLSTGTILAITANGTTPETYTHRILSTELKDPYGIALDFYGNILVTDYQTGRGPLGGGLFKLDRYSLELSTVSTGGSFVVPFGVAVDDFDGTIYVADSDANGFQGGIYQIDPDTQVQTEIATGFHWLRGIAVDFYSGDVLVTDLGSDTAGHEILWRIDPTGTFDTESVTLAQEFTHPDGLVHDPFLDQYVIAEAIGKKIITVEACGCDTNQPQTVLSTGLPSGSINPGDSVFNLPTHVAFGFDFDSFTSSYYVTDAPIDAPSGSRRLLRVNPDDGATEIVSSGGFFEQPRGLAVVPFNPNFYPYPAP